MKRVFAISKVNWTVVLGLFFTVLAVTITATLSVAAFKSDVVNASSGINVVRQLATPSQVDQLARSKYQEEQAAKKAAAEAAAQEAARLAAQTTPASAKAGTTRTTTRKTTSKPAPTCDRLIIPKIGLNACLATVGLTSGGAVGVHASLPAWFNQSSRAGTRNGRYSATFIDGHRSGIFRNLGRLAVGDTITVTFVSGESYTYIVRFTESQPLNKVDMGKALSIYGGAGQGLNLMTCDGAYNSSIGTAESRLTVYATR